MVEGSGSIQSLPWSSEIGAKCMVMGAAPCRDDRGKIDFIFTFRAGPGG